MFELSPKKLLLTFFNSFLNISSSKGIEAAPKHVIMNPTHTRHAMQTTDEQHGQQRRFSPIDTNYISPDFFYSKKNNNSLTIH